MADKETVRYLELEVSQLSQKNGFKFDYYLTSWKFALD